MGLDIWFAEDIRNALAAANEASVATVAVIADIGRGPSTNPSTGSGQDSGQGPSAGQGVANSTELLTVSLRAYREGYKAALSTIALAFGIAPQAITLRPCSGQALRQAQDEALQPLGEPEITYLSPNERGLRGGAQFPPPTPQPLQPPGSREEP